MTPFLIGITGRIASGKSVAAGYISEAYHFHLIDADTVGHQILEEPLVIKDIAHHFPSAFNVTLNSIRRDILSDIVFHDTKLLHVLQSITWTAILAKIHQEIEQYPRSVIEAIGLFQSSLYKQCDCTVYIDCTSENIQKRLQLRGVSDEKMQKILHSQKDHASLVSLADIVIPNNTTLSDFMDRIDTAMKKVLSDY